MRILKPMTLAFLFPITGTLGQAAELGESAIDHWQASTGVILSPAARMQLVQEAKTVTTRIQETESLKGKFRLSALEGALGTYLNNNLNGTKSPSLLTLTVEQLSPGGLGVAYPTKFPVLALTTTFDMTGIMLNQKLISFSPTKNKKVLLSLGANEISTHGGGVADCRYTIKAEEGFHYVKACPDRP